MIALLARNEDTEHVGRCRYRPNIAGSMYLHEEQYQSGASGQRVARNNKQARRCCQLCIPYVPAALTVSLRLRYVKDLVLGACSVASERSDQKVVHTMYGSGTIRSTWL